MSQNVETKKIETTASLYFGDGLLDIALGLGLIIAWVLMIFDQMAFVGVYIVLLVPIMQSIKKTVTVPRLASLAVVQAEEAERRRKITGFLILTLLLGLVTFFFFAMGALARPSWLVQYAGVGLVALGVGLMAFMAWIIKAKRFFIYAGLMAVVFAAGYWFGIDAPYSFIGLGILILLPGLEILRRFITTNPTVGH